SRRARFLRFLASCAIATVFGKGCRMVDAEPVASPERPIAPQAATPSTAPPPEAPAATVPSPPLPTAAPSVARQAATPRGPRRVYVVAALGDSLTDFRSHGGGYLRYLKERCPESTFDGYGKGGDMVNQMRRRLGKDLLDRPQANYD